MDIFINFAKMLTYKPTTMINKYLLGLASVLFAGMSYGQEVQGFVHERSDSYEWPTDSAVLEKLDRWQDQKFGVLMHWGLYSVPGIVESWSICSEDVDWISRRNDMTYDEYKKWYYSLADSLVPVDFDPAAWAELMKDAGMKYMIFTTKHHDGFNMFDTKYSDFSIAKGPFASDPRKDVARHVFDAFRDKDFMIGCYFSKPDWHYEYYWNPNYATPNRRHNYKIERHPEWWQNYRNFAFNQVNELMTEYGDFDILWLDGGWVTGDDIYLDSLLSKVRSTTQPGLISVDRTIKGRNENYQTPERSIPDTQLPYPWESCITLSNDWGWVPNAPYKSPEKVVGLLAEIVAKGGCFVLGVGPTAQGTIEEEAAWRLRKIGEWLNSYGKAIYSTRPTPIYNDGFTWFTADKNGKTLYAIYALPEGEKLPSEISWKGNVPRGAMRLLKGNKKVNYKVASDGTVTVKLPKGLPDEPLAFEFDVK